jgi:hypothetical protein
VKRPRCKEIGTSSSTEQRRSWQPFAQAMRVPREIIFLNGAPGSGKVGGGLGQASRRRGSGALMGWFG